MTMKVSPESIHLAARKVTAAGEDWGDAWTKLRSHVADTSSLFGGDAIGQAMAARHDPYAPKAITHAQETGFCLVEAGRGLDLVAGAYTDMEADNAARAAAVQKVLDRVTR